MITKILPIFPKPNPVHREAENYKISTVAISPNIKIGKTIDCHADSDFFRYLYRAHT